ncbi:MAG: branched-chain amino acid ABC transporter substrate-binding protein [Rhodospirillaceae bacterium]
MKKLALFTLFVVLFGAIGPQKLAAQISIGVAGPVTGQYASFGDQMLKGVEAAVRDVNAAGGVLGQKLKLVIGDDACDPKQAVAVANQFASKGVKFVVGHFCSGSSIPASNVYAEEDILQISPASTNPQLTERKLDNVFRTCGRDDQQGLVAGNFLADRYGGKKIAVIHDKTAYGKGLADETKKTLLKRNIKPALYEAYTAGEKDYSALISKLKVNAVEVLYVGGYHTEAGLMVRQMRQQGMNTILVSGDALVTQEFWGITGKAGQGTIMTFSPDPRKNAAAKRIVEQFRKGGYEPEGYTLYSYGAVQAWVQAVKAAGSLQTPKVIKLLRNGSFVTVLGKISFDSKGDVTAPGYVLYEWRDGKYDYIK